MSQNPKSRFDAEYEKIKKYNTCTDSSGYHYVRILKSFKSNASKSLCDKDEKLFFNKKLIPNFLLRFYLPKEAMSVKATASLRNEDHEEGSMPTNEDLDPKIEHVVVMINGFDEFHEDHFKLYNFLGTKFAEKNIASVLLSTPYHLHRMVMGEDKDKILRPSSLILENWKNLFYHYKITHQDILSLIKKIKQIAPSDEDDFNFYENHFSKNVKVSLLGYSLGGLIAFGFFLDNHERKDFEIENCVLFNAPGNLKNAHTNAIGISPGTWSEIFKKLGEPANQQSLRESSKNREYIDTFVNLYTSLGGDGNTKIEKAINSKFEKLLLIMCGSDEIIDIEPWQKYFKGESGKTKISQHIFAGIGHNPMYESRGSEVLPRIAGVITDHLLLNKEGHWQEHDIKVKIFELIKSTPYFKELILNLDKANLDRSFTKPHLKRLLNEIDQSETNTFLKYYYLSKIYYGKFYDLLDALKDDRNYSKKIKAILNSQ